MQAIGQLVAGATTSPLRAYIREAVEAAQPERVVVPFVGRFDAADAIAAGGVDPDRIYTWDPSLFSHVIAHLLDPALHLVRLEERLDLAPIEHLLGDFTDDYDRAAGILLGIKYLSLPADNLYTASIRRELKINSEKTRATIAGQLERIAKRLHGLHFTEAHEPLDEKTLVYLSAPVHEDGLGELRLGWKSSEAKGLKEMLAELADTPATVLAYVPHGSKVDPGWERVFAIAGSKKRVDYILANRAESLPRYATQKMDKKPTARFPIYDDQEITEDSVIEFVPVDEATALYYRDLFVHRLGTTSSGRYFLMLIDGRVTTALGLHLASVRTGKSTYVDETFGISRTSRRYERLGKLFMMALTSGDMKRVISMERSMGGRDIDGIQTTSLTQHDEGKTDRSVMKLVEKTPIKPAGFHLVYRADFRDDTWPEVLKNWLAVNAHKHRDEWVCENCPGAPAPVVQRKKKKGRGGARREEANV